MRPQRTTAEKVSEIESERRVLAKAEADIEDGWNRLHNQQQLLVDLQASGHNTVEAERLANLMMFILVEWERHRVLIEQRLAYLESELRSARG